MTCYCICEILSLGHLRMSAGEVYWQVPNDMEQSQAKVCVTIYCTARVFVYSLLFIYASYVLLPGYFQRVAIFLLKRLKSTGNDL